MNGYHNNLEWKRLLINKRYIYTPGHNNTYTSTVKGANSNEIT